MKPVLFVVILFSCISLRGQGHTGMQFLITMDNDFLGIDNEDENYTGALKLELLSPVRNSKWYPCYKFKGPDAINIRSVAIGGNAYTPRDLAKPTVVTGDRPYASLVYLIVGNISYETNKKMITQSELVMGLMGTSLPGKAQAWVHRQKIAGSRAVPRGWDNQIGFDGAFIVNYNNRMQGRLFETNDQGPDFKWLQANWVLDGDIGNYMINLQAGIKFSFLNLNTGLLQEFIPGSPGFLNSSSGKKFIRLNFFAEPHLRYALFDATLEGLMFGDNSVYKIPHKDVKRLPFEINAGVNLLLNDNLYLRYSFYGRTREFKGGKPFHNWASVSVGFSPGRWNHD